MQNNYLMISRPCGSPMCDKSRVTAPTSSHQTNDRWTSRGWLALCICLLTSLLYGCAGDATESRMPATHVEQLHIEAVEGLFVSDSSEEAKSLSYEFQGDNVFPKIQLKAGDKMEGFCLIRNENPNIPIKSIPVEWEADDRTLRSVRFSVDMKYPLGEDVGKWQVCFFLGKGSYDDRTGRVTFAAEKTIRPIAKNELQQWTLPYLSAWMTLKKRDDGRLYVEAVKFRPQGAFLRMQITNDTEHDVSMSAVRMSAADPSMHASPFAWAGTWQADSREEQQTTKPVLLGANEDFVCSLPAPLKLKAGETSGWYGLWVMPLGASQGYSSNIYVEPTDRAVSAKAPWWLYHTPLEGRADSQGSASGRSYKFSLRMRKVVATTLENWMQDIEDNRLVCKMSIPGTHDTGAYTGIAWVKTQDKNIKEQLASGIRVFDIRLVRDGGVLKLCHSSAIFDVSFIPDVLRATAEFLRDHPSETVIMTLKRDHDKDNDGGAKYREAVAQALVADPFVTPYIAGAFKPDFTMGDLRGKMLILSREGWYSTGSGYVPRWPDNKSFSSTIESVDGSHAPLHVEDTYKTSSGNKVNLVRQNLLKANAAFSSNANEWFITFSSTAGPLGGAFPSATTNEIDPKVINILKGGDNLRTCGILLFNFAGWWDDGMTKSIIRLNQNAPTSAN